jgi:hypothetical protein
MSGHTNGFAGAMVVAAGPALAKVQPDTSRAFEPGSIAEAMNMAALLVKSRLLPDSVQSPEAAFAIIATGRELGLTAMQSLRSIHVIKGKTILSADLVAALVKSRRDVCQFFMLVESTTERAIYKTQRVGEPEPTTLSFTMDDAKRAQVTGNPNWQKYPAAMLRARCITALARAVYPDLAMGVYDPDEIGGEPVPPPQAYEPVPSRAAPTASPPDITQYATLCEAIDAADSAAGLNGCARATQKAHRSGAITDAQLQAIVDAVKKKRAAIEVPPAPPSEPKAEEVSQ